MIPQQVFNAALLGLVLGLLAIYSRSLFPAMIFHFLNNALATFHAAESQTAGWLPTACSSRETGKAFSDTKRRC